MTEEKVAPEEKAPKSKALWALLVIPVMIAYLILVALMGCSAKPEPIKAPPAPTHKHHWSMWSKPIIGADSVTQLRTCVACGVAEARKEQLQE